MLKFMVYNVQYDRIVFIVEDVFEMRDKIKYDIIVTSPTYYGEPGCNNNQPLGVLLFYQIKYQRQEEE